MPWAVARVIGGEGQPAEKWDFGRPLIWGGPVRSAGSSLRGRGVGMVARWPEWPLGAAVGVRSGRAGR